MNLDENTIKRLEAGGFIRAKFRPYGVIFATFEELRKNNNYRESIEMTSEKCNACTTVVAEAVAAFKRMKE